MAFYDLPSRLRQLGDQEADIIGMVKGITKYAEIVREPETTIRHHLEKGNLSGAIGKAWPLLDWDIPIDVQGAQINPDSLQGYTPEIAPRLETARLQKLCEEIRLRDARLRNDPSSWWARGIRIGHARELLLRLLGHWAVPVVTAWNAHDTIWDEHPQYAGRPGSIGDRPGNFAVQNSDFLLVLGSRLNIRQVSYNWKSFARDAFKVIVDIDAAELNKPTVRADLPIHADVKDVLENLLSLPPITISEARRGWIDQCLAWQKKYPVVLPEYWQGKNGVNPYCFVSTLFDLLADDDIVVCGDGTACVTSFLPPRSRKTSGFTQIPVAPRWAMICRAQSARVSRAVTSASSVSPATAAS